MDILTIDDLRELVNLEQKLFISLYMPTFRKGVDIKQNPTRLKKLLREAENKLYSMDLRKAEVESFLKPASDLIDETTFWQQQSDGLVIFLYEDGIKYYRLPFEFKESISISNKLYIKPLLPLFSGNGQFLILAISKHEFRLFQGTRQIVREIELEDAPKSMLDMQVDDDPRTNLITITASPQGGSELSYNKVTQGQAPENDYEVNELTRFFRAVDESLSRIDKKEKMPLVLSGVEYLIPIFKEISSYPYITDDFIRGNPELLDGDELRNMAWDIVEPIFRKDQDLAEEKFKQFSGQKNKLFATSLNRIIPAAYSGQIESLFVANGVDQWGKFDHDTNKIKFNGEEQEGDEDLLEYASVLTLSRGGKVFSVEPSNVPDGGKVAAVLRY